jgi:hypothetical protein
MAGWLHYSKTTDATVLEHSKWLGQRLIVATQDFLWFFAGVSRCWFVSPCARGIEHAMP